MENSIREQLFDILPILPVLDTIYVAGPDRIWAAKVKWFKFSKDDHAITIGLESGRYFWAKEVQDGEPLSSTPTMGFAPASWVNAGDMGTKWFLSLMEAKAAALKMADPKIYLPDEIQNCQNCQYRSGFLHECTNKNAPSLSFGLVTDPANGAFCPCFRLRVPDLPPDR